MSFQPFKLYHWVDPRGAKAEYNLCGSASPARSINDLIRFSNDPKITSANLDFHDLKLGYNSCTTGSDALKTNIASLFDTPVESNNILTTIGASLANQIVLHALLRPGDHVICTLPIYTQLFEVPRAIGASVSFWRHDPQKNWQLDIHELDALVRDNTRMIIVNNPNNPTGAYLDDKLQQQIITFAKKRNLIVLADEIFRPLFHSLDASVHGESGTNGHAENSQTIPKSFLDHSHADNLDCSRVVVTSSVSKSRSFPGLRIGWITSRDPSIISACENIRSYALNSVNPIDEIIAAEALSYRCRDLILDENLKTARKGLSVLSEFIKTTNSNDKSKYRIEWVPPPASSTTLIRFINTKTNTPLNDVKLCEASLERAKLLLIPASQCFDMDAADIEIDIKPNTSSNTTFDGNTNGKTSTNGISNANGTGHENGHKEEKMQGWLRIGFVVDETYLRKCLAVLHTFLESYEEDQH